MAHLDGFEAESYLKSGSNELRILEYSVCGLSFGINILKVKKIVSHLNQFISIPESHPAIRGVFQDRGIVVPLIDLAFFLGIPRDENSPPQKVIITEFFELQNGLWVDRIDWIHRFRWEDVIDAAGIMHGFDQKYVIGIVKPSEDKMVLLLDYENIILDICPQFRSEANQSFDQSQINGRGKRILVAEDSPAIRNMLATEFTEVGFEVQSARDGHEALEIFQKTDPPFDLVISDVEMPRMDGLALTVAIRSGEHKDTPVIVYSSIGDMGMKSRANFLKANAHITKLNFDDLITEVEKQLGMRNSVKEDSPALTEESSRIQEEIAEETKMNAPKEKEVEIKPVADKPKKVRAKAKKSPTKPKKKAAKSTVRKSKKAVLV
jgi:two-component system chemotaxis response regulator CheV